MMKSYYTIRLVQKPLLCLSRKMVEKQRDLRLLGHNTSKGCTTDGLRADAVVCSALEFIPLAFSRLNTQGSGQRAIAHRGYMGIIGVVVLKSTIEYFSNKYSEKSSVNDKQNNRVKKMIILRMLVQWI